MSAKNLIIRGGADFSAVKKELAKTQKHLTSWQKGINKTLAGIGLILGGITIGSFVKDLIQTSAKTETLNVAMAAVARSTGTSAEALKEYKKEVMGLGVAEQEATQIMTRFMQSQLNVADAARVVRVAQDAGTIAGMNSSVAANQMVEAIAKLRPELLSAFGFTRNLNDIYKDYAKTVGKTVKQLGEAEKKQAMVNYILNEGKKIAGSYEAAMGTFGKKLGSIDKLTLPKKLMQELKTSLGAPLILPGAGVVLDSLIEQLSAIKKWALDNEATLRRWGQTIANTVRSAVKGFKLVTGAIAENWQALKFVGITLLSYTAITKGAAAATAAFRLVQLALKGELVTQVPVLSAVSLGIGTYRLQMALAPVATNMFTAALLRLRAALYAVHTAFGPVGWVVLAVSGLLAGGISLWNKYNQSLQKTAFGGLGLSKTNEDLAKGIDGSTEALEDQEKALDGAGKAAQRNLQSFDEINQLQKDSAGGGAGAEDFDLGDIGVGGGGGDWDEMLNGLEDALENSKATFKGFLEWMWDAWSDYVQSWDWVQKLSDWIVDTFYDAERGVWSLQRTWQKWSDYVQSWNWVQNLSDWIVDTFFDAEQGVWSLKHTWQKWSEYVQSWGWVQGLTGWVVGVLEKWDGFRKDAGKTWEGIKATINTKWDDLKTNAGTTWDNIKNTIKTKWDDLKTDAPVVWDNIKTNLETRWAAISTSAKKTWADVKTSAQNSWNDLKKDAPTAWENIKTTIATKTNDTWINLKKTWDEASKYTSKTWADVKTNSGTTWDNVKSLLAQKWNDIQATSNNTFSNIKTNAISAWNDIKNRAPGIWENIKNSMVNPLESAKQTLLNIVATIKNAFNNMRIEIPKPKLPHVSVSSKSKQVGDINVPYPDFSIDWYAQGGIFNSPSVIGVGEAGSEAVLPLDHNTGWMDSLAAKIAASIPGGQAGGDVYVYIGNDQIDAYIHRSQDRRNIRSNGR